MVKSNPEIVELKTNLINIDKRLSVLECDTKNLLPKIIVIQQDVKHLIETMTTHIDERNKLNNTIGKRLEVLDTEQTKIKIKVEKFAVKIGGILTVIMLFITAFFSWLFNKFFP